MFAADQALRLLVDATWGSRGIDNPEEWILATALEPLVVANAAMGLSFADAPTAAALSGALAEVDRNARRVATAIDRQIPPRQLFGRGKRILPPTEGLIVQRAQEGSLDLLLLLGGIYQAVISQPLSFVLNVASLLQLGRLGVRAIMPKGDEKSTELKIAPTKLDSEIHRELFGDDAIELPTPHGMVRVPKKFQHVRFYLETSDGSKLYFEAAPDTSHFHGS